ncbi:MAG: glycosyltransferase family 1 protein [Pseudomonadaceae bacterium]|nr:glycosyltransferase family 1 protein [Pseudomonadaceae bacterium]
MATAQTVAMNPTSLHIALISETLSHHSSGATNTLDRLCAGLIARGHQLQRVRPRRSSDAGRRSDAHLLLTHGWPLPGYPELQWGLAARHKLYQHWQLQRPDVLYIASAGPLGLAALWVARRLGIPVVSGLHSNFQQRATHSGLGLFNHLLAHYLRWFHNRSQLTLVPSVSQCLELTRRGYQRLQLMTRGVDGELFNPRKRSSSLRASWGLAEEDIGVLHVGRLASEKNLELLASSFSALQSAYPQRRCKLIVVGDGPQRGALQQALPEAIFTGVQRGETLAEHYASADVFLFPSLCHSFANVLLEALASGLGVVAFDQAAAGQHIRHGHNGALAIPHDSADFIDAAIWLLAEPETLRRVRLNARQHASRQGWETTIQLLESHLRNTCTAASAPAISG